MIGLGGISLGANDRVPTVHAKAAAAARVSEKQPHHPWSAFIRYCAELQHGEIELLKIQDGLPVLAEVTRKKVKFVG